MDIDGIKGRAEEVEGRGEPIRETSGSGSLLQPSASPILPEDRDGIGSPEDGEVRKPGRKRRAHTACQVCQTSLNNERPYYQVSN